MICETPQLISNMSVAHFRDLMPEFQDSSVYLDEMLEPWLTIASNLLNMRVWGSMYSMGIALFVAHQISLSRASALSARRGGAPGVGVGIVTNKSVNGVSIGYDVGSIALDKGGDWNLTTYGIRFLSFARMFGSGGVQVVGIDARNISEWSLLSGTVGQFPPF